jgi:hypothetical protein
MESNEMECGIEYFSNKLYIKVMNNISVDLNSCYRSCEHKHSQNLINANKILFDFEANHANSTYSKDDLTTYRHLRTNVDNLLESFNICRKSCTSQHNGGGRTRSTTQQTKNKTNRRRHTRNARRRGRGRRTRRYRK